MTGLTTHSFYVVSFVRISFDFTSSGWKTLEVLFELRLHPQTHFVHRYRKYRDLRTLPSVPAVLRLQRFFDSIKNN